MYNKQNNSFGRGYEMSLAWDNQKNPYPGNDTKDTHNLVKKEKIEGKN